MEASWTDESELDIFSRRISRHQVNNRALGDKTGREVSMQIRGR
jgi:hypothetical protein